MSWCIIITYRVSGCDSYRTGQNPGFNGSAVEGVLWHVASAKRNLIFLAVASPGDI